MRFRERRTVRPALATTLAAALIGTGAAAAHAQTAAPVRAAVAAPTAATLERHVTVGATRFVAPVASSTSSDAYGAPFVVAVRTNRRPSTSQASGGGALLAVLRSGEQHVIGTAGPDTGVFSTTDGLVVATVAKHPHTLTWWRPTAHRASTPHGTLVIPSDERYLGAAPDGVVTITADGTLMDRSVVGSTSRVLAHPYPSDTDVEGASGPTGIVLSNRVAPVFVRFDHGTVTPLQVAAGPAGSYPRCWGATARTAACGAYAPSDQEESAVIRTVAAVPLSGAAPAHPAVPACTGEDYPADPVAISGGAAWLCDGLQVLRSDGTVAVLKGYGRADLVGSFGGVVTPSAARTTLKLVSARTLAASTLLGTTRSVSEASWFALTGGAVVWKEDDGGPLPADIRVHRRSVAVNGAGAGLVIGRKTSTLGTARTVAGVVAASGSTSVWAVRHQAGSETLQVVSPHGRHTITNVDTRGGVTVGSGRVLYRNAGSRKYHLYDTRIGKDTAFAAASAALSGTHLVYATAAGRTIREKNLATGAAVTVHRSTQPPPVRPSLYEVQVFAWGQYAGWVERRFDGVFQRDYDSGWASADGTLHQLPATEALWALADEGAITVPVHRDRETGIYWIVTPTTAMYRSGIAYSLRPYDADTSAPAARLLTLDHPVAGPQLGHRVLAWIDWRGRLQVRLRPGL